MVLITSCCEYKGVIVYTLCIDSTIMLGSLCAEFDLFEQFVVLVGQSGQHAHQQAHSVHSAFQFQYLL